MFHGLCQYHLSAYRYSQKVEIHTQFEVEEMKREKKIREQVRKCLAKVCYGYSTSFKAVLTRQTEYSVCIILAFLTVSCSRGIYPDKIFMYLINHILKVHVVSKAMNYFSLFSINLSLCYRIP